MNSEQARNVCSLLSGFLLGGGILWLGTRSCSSERCWDCKHAIAEHSGEYEGWDARTQSFLPEKQEGTGCLVDGCPCRKWFQVEGFRDE